MFSFGGPFDVLDHASSRDPPRVPNVGIGQTFVEHFVPELLTDAEPAHQLTFGISFVRVDEAHGIFGFRHFGSPIIKAYCGDN